MPITRIQITNMATFTAIDYALPMVCLIQGGNGVGKTGLLDCIRCLGESGHDPDILHGNAAEGETIVTMDDGAQLRVRVTRAETWRGWKPKDGKRWIKGREEIDKVYRAIAYDPMKFLELTPKQQAETLASLSPVQATEEEIRAAVGDAEAEAAAVRVREGMSSLELINAVSKTIYDARTAYNTGADTQGKHASQLEQSLPPATLDGVGWEEKAEQLAREMNAIEATIQDKKDAAQKHYIAACAEVDKEINAEIAALEEKRAERKNDIRTDIAAGVEAVRSANKPTIDRLNVDLGIAQERARAQQQADGTRAAADAARREATQKRARSKTLTEALDRLQALKLRLVAKFPIKGAMIEDGKIVREQDGGVVPLKKWNTADQYVLALKIGMMIGGGFVLLDGAECFDKPHREALLKACNKYAEEGVQFVISSVDPAGGPLVVEPAVTKGGGSQLEGAVNG